MFSFLSMKGFLGTGATFGADLNLVVQFIMGAALVAGAALAKKKRCTAHGICQTTVLLLNLIMIALVMLPSFRLRVVPATREFFANVITPWPRFTDSWVWRRNFWDFTSSWWRVRTRFRS